MEMDGGGGGGEADTGRTTGLGPLVEATGSSEKCPDGVKLRHAPLDNEQAMVWNAIPDAGTSYVQLEEDEAGSACEGFVCNASTFIDGKVKDSEEIEEITQMLEIVIEDGAEKGSVVYSYATQLFKKKEIRDMFSIFKKQDGRLEWLERTWDPVRWEIRRMMKMVVEDGAKVGSDEYFYVSQLCIKKECRDVFSTLKTPVARLAWIKRTWEEEKKH